MITSIEDSWEPLRAAVGTDLGASEPQTIDQAMVDAHAATTGDAQWIHNDPERARREGPYGGPVVQGFLLLSLLSRHGAALRIPESGSVAMLVNYGFDRVRFVAPVPVGATVRVRGRLADVRPKGSDRAVVVLDVVMEARSGDAAAVDAVIARWCFLAVRG
jgi:acyl dehydratase